MDAIMSCVEAEYRSSVVGRAGAHKMKQIGECVLLVTARARSWHQIQQAQLLLALDPVTVAAPLASPHRCCVTVVGSWFRSADWREEGGARPAPIRGEAGHHQRGGSRGRGGTAIGALHAPNLYSSAGLEAVPGCLVRRGRQAAELRSSMNASLLRLQ